MSAEWAEISRNVRLEARLKKMKNYAYESDYKQ